MGEYSADRPAVSIGSKAEGYACPKDGAALTIIEATPTRDAGAWCPECHTVWREVGEISLKDLDDLPETAASLMSERTMVLPRCGQCASGRHSHCEHPDFPAPARSCCCGLLEFEDPVVDLEDRQAMALVAKFWAESDEGGEVTDASTTARRRGTTLSPAELFVLDQWGRQLQDAFDQTPYLVGSAERGGDWRDVDVRMLLPWAEDVMSAFGVYTLNVAISLWGRHVTGLPIDFQMQGEQAFHGYDGETRNPLGGRSKTKYRGVTKFALGLDDDGGERVRSE